MLARIRHNFWRIAERHLPCICGNPPKADLQPRQSLNLSLRISHLSRHFDFSVNIYPKCGTFKVFIVLFDLKFLKKLAKMEAVN